MAFLNSLIASSSQPRSASSMPRELCSSERTSLSCPLVSRPMVPQITQKGGPGLPSAPAPPPRVLPPSLVPLVVVVTEILEALARVDLRFHAVVLRLAACKAAGRCREQLADVAPEHAGDPDGSDGDQRNDDQILAHALSRLAVQQLAEDATHWMAP